MITPGPGQYTISTSFKKFSNNLYDRYPSASRRSSEIGGVGK